MDHRKPWDVPPSSPLPDVRGSSMQSRKHGLKRGRSPSMKGQAMLTETSPENEKSGLPHASASKRSREAPPEGVQPDNAQLRMMVVDQVIEEGIAAVGSRGEGGRPPRALLYGLTAEGQSVCCHVSGEESLTSLAFRVGRRRVGPMWLTADDCPPVFT